MLRATSTVLAHGQYQERLKVRMAGYVPKVVPRKLKGALCSFRSEANTGYFVGHVKNPTERMDNSGKRLQRVIYDPIVCRHVVAKETKIKAPTLTKSHIQRKLTTPF
jgi:hypothetical protein